MSHHNLLHLNKLIFFNLLSSQSQMNWVLLVLVLSHLKLRKKSKNCLLCGFLHGGRRAVSGRSLRSIFFSSSFRWCITCQAFVIEKKKSLKCTNPICDFPEDRLDHKWNWKQELSRFGISLLHWRNSVHSLDINTDAWGSLEHWGWTPGGSGRSCRAVCAASLHLPLDRKGSCTT